jgi:hypothetical protein
VGRQLDEDDEDDEYGQQVKRGGKNKNGNANTANHRDTYRNNYNNRDDSDY